MPNHLLRIGDFSHLAQVSVPTLRHYNDLGLLTPAHVDPHTDYRYYALEQLPRLNRILALKDLGLSLEQIGWLLQKALPAEHLREMLADKRADIEQALAREQQRLARVEARLRQIEGEDAPPEYDVLLKRVEPQIIVGTRQIVPHVSEMDRYREPTWLRFYAALQTCGIASDDIKLEMALYHSPEYHEDHIDMEIAGVLTRPLQKKIESALGGSEGEIDGLALTVRTLPAVETMASTIHHGALYDIPQAIIALHHWLGANGYRSAGPMRECHLFGSEMHVRTVEDARKPHILEIQVPAERDAALLAADGAP